MNTSLSQTGSRQHSAQRKLSGLWDKIERLFARLLTNRREARRTAIREAESKRQEIIELRRRLRDGLHRRLDK